jgi:lipopolysaccharide transport system ATP-binding protein
MSNTVISVENVSKAYRLGQIGTGTLKDDLQVWWAKLRGQPNPLQKIGALDHNSGEAETIWALKDINLQVQQGEVLGIIGRNGAGKSTLLKILSKVTAPTSGEVKIKGRIASLLEVGTGFHPELTGRENIYLNGAILGMNKPEITRKFDEIVDFSGVEQFIDTPVKRYSSGMYVRLAFAVAAHLEPEILLVDEVLAVGDADFQKKCLGKMGEVAKEGRTVLFVSHNMQAVSLLCPSTALLESGRIAARESTSRVVTQYLSSGSSQSARAVWRFEDAPGTKTARLHSVSALNEKGEVCADLWLNKPITLAAQFWILRRARVEISFHLYNQQGMVLFATGNFHAPDWRGVEHDPGLYAASCTIPEHFLNDGQYYIKVYLHHGRTHRTDAVVPEAISFRVLDPGDTRGDWTGPWIGLIRPLLPWAGARIGDPP